MLNLNEIHHGCCLDLMQHIPGGSVDMILCDLPYGTTACKWDTIIPFDKLWAAYERIIKPNGAIVLTGIQPFTSLLIASNLKSFRYEWIWHKTRNANFYFLKKQPAKKHENVCVFYKKQPTYNPQMVAGEPYQDTRKKKERQSESVVVALPNLDIINNGQRFPETVQRFGSVASGNVHPTQKPVALFEYLIRTYTNPGEVVLDNCAGSATTAIAALNTGRQFICIEQEEKYVQVGRKRIHERQPTLLFA